MVFKNNQESPAIGVQEAHILWRLLSDRYVIIDHISQLQNFTHDEDFSIYLNQLIKGYKEDVKILVAKLDKYSIAGPPPNVAGQNATGNSEIVRDRETAQIIFGYMRLDLALKLYSLIDTHENREVRLLIMNFVKKSLSRIDTLIKYMKLKNWMDQPPLYKYSNQQSAKVAANEVFLLYDHLVFRYLNLRQTKYFEAFTSDTDFRVLLDLGTDILNKQISQLESKLLHYGVTLPKGFSETTPSNVNSEIISDRYMFTAVLKGMQNSISLHGIAIIEVTYSDDLRDFFKQILFDELDFVDKMILYGQTKGWVFPSPKYQG